MNSLELSSKTNTKKFEFDLRELTEPLQNILYFYQTAYHKIRNGIVFFHHPEPTRML